MGTIQIIGPRICVSFAPIAIRKILTLVEAQTRVVSRNLKVDLLELIRMEKGVTSFL